MHVYLDESGDLGFDLNKKGTSNHFVITMLLTREPKRVANCVKRLKTTALRKKYKKMPEIKFNNSPLSFKRMILRKLAKQNIFVFAFALKKAGIQSKLHDQKHKVYNYVTGLLFDKILPFLLPEEEIVMVVDKVKRRKIEVDDFNLYLRMKLVMAGDEERRLTIDHADSQKNISLQAVDFVAGAIFQKYEHKGREFYDLISKRIKFEVFWPK